MFGTVVLGEGHRGRLAGSAAWASIDCSMTAVPRTADSG